MQSANNKNVELRATMRAVDNTKLEITLHVENHKTVNLYVFSIGLNATPDGLKILREQRLPAWVEGDTLFLASKLIAPPPGVTWATPPKVYAVQLKPGATHETVINVPLPIQAMRDRPSWRLPTPAQLPEQIFKKVNFELGFVTDTPNLQARSIEVEGKEVHELYAGVLHSQEVVTAPFDQQVQVVVHPD